jgi:hypothetical protein
VNRKNDSNLEFGKLHKTYVERGFEEGTDKDPHQEFWEVYIASALMNKGIALCKDSRSSGAPDFFFEQDGIKIHVEATAPKLGEGKHAVAPMPVLIDENDVGDFESGIVPADQIRLRFANALQMKTEQINKWKKQGTIAPGDAVVLAINGYEALGGRASVDGQMEPKYIIQVLYGLGDSFMNQDGERFIERTNAIRKGTAKIENECSFSGKLPVCGVLYSTVSLGDLSPQHEIGKDFEYFPNPSMVNWLRTFDGWWKRR